MTSVSERQRQSKVYCLLLEKVEELGYDILDCHKCREPILVSNKDSFECEDCGEEPVCKSCFENPNLYPCLEELPCCDECEERMTAHGTCTECLEKHGYGNLDYHDLCQVYCSRFGPEKLKEVEDTGGSMQMYDELVDYDSRNLETNLSLKVSADHKDAIKTLLSPLDTMIVRGSDETPFLTLTFSKSDLGYASLLLTREGYKIIE